MLIGSNCRINCPVNARSPEWINSWFSKTVSVSMRARLLADSELSESLGCDGGGDGDCEDIGDVNGKGGSRSGARAEQVRLTVLLAFAALMVYLGFVGGEKLGELVNSGTGAISSVRMKTAGGQLTDDGESDDSDGVDNLELPQLLHTYYKNHNPDILGDVPMILERYAGREKELFQKLEIKYGAPVLDMKAAFDGSDGQGGGSQVEAQTNDADMKEQEDDAESKHEQRPAKRERARRRTKVIGEEEEEEEEVEDEEVEDEEVEDEELENEDGGSGNDMNDGLNDEDDKEDESDLSSSSIPAPDHGFNVYEETHVSKVRGGRGKLKAIVIGFPGTGVDHVTKHLTDGLGWKSLSADETCAAFLSILMEKQPEFNKFNRLDVIADDSAALFYEQLMATYPDAQVLITVRDVDDWYGDFSSKLSHMGSDPSLLLRRDVYQTLLGGGQTLEQASPFLWKKRYQHFYDRMLATVSRSRRKLVSIYGDDHVGHKPWDHWVTRFLQQNYPSVKLKHGCTPFRAPPNNKLRSSSKFMTDPMSKLHVSALSPAHSYGQLQILGIGLEATGLDALAAMLHKVDYSVAFNAEPGGSFHCSHDCKRVLFNVKGVIDGTNPAPNFGQNGVFHGVDAVLGAPTHMLVQEALASNPNLKVILTVRNLENWWSDLSCKHARKKNKVTTVGVAGAFANKCLYQDMLHMASYVPSDRLLILDVERTAIKDEAWPTLCAFLQIKKCHSSKTSLPMIKPC